jgi:hypothetical protein
MLTPGHWRQGVGKHGKSDGFTFSMSVLQTDSSSHKRPLKLESFSTGDGYIDLAQLTAHIPSRSLCHRVTIYTHCNHIPDMASSIRGDRGSSLKIEHPHPVVNKLSQFKLKHILSKVALFSCFGNVRDDTCIQCDLVEQEKG